MRCPRAAWTFWALFLLVGRAPTEVSSLRLLSTESEPGTAADVPDAQPDILKDQWIVTFQRHIRSNADALSALARLSQSLNKRQQQLPSIVEAAAVGAAPFQLLKLLTASSSRSSSSAGPAAAAVAGEVTGASSSSGLPQAAVLYMSPAAADLVRSSPEVAAVIPDMLITAAVLPAGAVAAQEPPADAQAPPVAAAELSSSWEAAADEQSVQASSSSSSALRQTPGASCTPAPRRGWLYSSVTYCPDVPYLVPGSSPRQLVAAAETVPEGLEAIEAARAAASSLPNPTAKRMAAVTVAVMDAGVDKAHPQLRFAGGRTFGVKASTQFPLDGDAGVDYFGTGTHVAGTVAAKNDGSGVVGVAPGARIYSLKVMAGNGVGQLSDMLDAASWVAAQGVAKFGIRVAVLGISVALYPDSYFYNETRAAICEAIDALDAAGVMVVAAAGNSWTGMKASFPAACSSTLVATAVRNAASAASSADGLAVPASKFTNFLDLDKNTAAADVARVVAAPGEDVVSLAPTVPAASGGTGSTAAPTPATSLKSGTSMAAAHVAGVAANCLASGACSLRGLPALWLAAIVAAAQERATRYSPRFGFKGDPLSPVSGRYYGWLVWSKW